MKAGFIGLGSMGAPIARRLARCGFSVVANDVSPAAMQALADEPGVQTEADPVATARQSEMLGICVRTDEQLESVASDALFAALGAGGVVLIHSTVAPDLARRLAERAKAVGVGLLDVGVSGGGPAAIEGKLSLFVGGEDAVLAKAKPWLDAIGRTAHLGPVGRGLEGKLLNNLISVANYGMSAAILDVGDSLGFDRAQLSEALMAGSAQSFALKAVPGLLRPRPGAPESIHDLLKKDVDHARDLPSSDRVQMDALLAACEAMLARLKRDA